MIEPCPAITRRTWTGTPASAIQVRALVAQAVSTEMFVAEVSHDVVPMGRVAEDEGGP